MVTWCAGRRGCCHLITGERSRRNPASQRTRTALRPPRSSVSVTVLGRLQCPCRTGITKRPCPYRITLRLRANQPPSDAANPNRSPGYGRPRAWRRRAFDTSGVRAVHPRWLRGPRRTRFSVRRQHGEPAAARSYRRRDLRLAPSPRLRAKLATHTIASTTAAIHKKWRANPAPKRIRTKSANRIIAMTVRLSIFR